jgi:class 3 adenylate cyclase
LQQVPDGERKTVTALFADIKGSMDLLEDLDPERARAIIDPALKIMIDAVHRYDGYIVQSTGDGIFALFGAPVAHEDHPHRALLSALKMQDDLLHYSTRLREAGDSPIEVRVGVNTGEAVVRTIRTDELHAEYTPIGHSTSLAARMQALAPTGSIAVTETVRRLVEGYFELKPLGPTRVKGLSELINVYEVVGLGPLRTRLQASARRGLSKFVGRDAEMAQMHHALDLARAGRGQIVAAVGDAGVGKSRLFHEFKIIAHEGCLTLETFSVSHGKASAYLPLIDLLRNYFAITPDDDDRRRREKIAGKVLMLDRALEDALPYLFSLLGVSEPEASEWENRLDRLAEYLAEQNKQSTQQLAEMDAEIRRRRTLDAVKRLLLRESLNQPLIVMFEDLHWVDSETQAFLNLFADSIGTARVLLMVNYRPEYRHEWSAKSYYAQLRLDPLGRESAESLLGALLGDGADLAPLKRIIIERSEGNPFFIEETVQAMFEEGVLARNGKVSLARPLSTIRIPASVKGILAARIDRLAPAQKDLLQTLAIIGKEFQLGLARRVVGRAEDELIPMLSDLQLGEFIFEQPAFPDIEYVFKHALTQEVAYESVLTEKRKVIHERTALALEEIYVKQIEDHLPDLAHHFSRSANVEKAIDYLFRAGEQARDQSAYDEAIEKIAAAADLLTSLPQTPERNAREVRMRTLLGQTIAAARGFSAPEMGRIEGRVRELIGRVTDPTALFTGTFGLWSAEFGRGNLPSTEELAQRLLKMVPQDATDLRKPSAYSLLGTSQLWRGRVIEACENLTRAADLFDRDIDNSLRSSVAPMVPNRSQLSWALWFAGSPDRALKRSKEAIELAHRLGRPYSIAFALQFAVSLSHYRRDIPALRVQIPNLLTFATESGFPLHAATATVSMGRLLVEEGERERGYSMIREGLDRVQRAGGELTYRFLMVIFADGCLLGANVDEGMRAVDIAHEAIEKFDERILEPEIHRLRGEFMLLSGASEAAAEERFRTAMRTAGTMQMKSLELRAATSLARLMMKGRPADARAVLVPVYESFTEGLDTPDLVDAKALLAQSGR